jgi:hypothetical protein
MVQHMKVVCVSVGLLVALSGVNSVSSAMRHRAALPQNPVRINPKAAQGSLAAGPALHTAALRF